MADVRPHPHDVMVHAVRRTRGAGQKTRDTKDVMGVRQSFALSCEDSPGAPSPTGRGLG